MTIHQLKEPCWVISPRLPREDHDPHYDTRAEALGAIREAWDFDRDWAFDDQLRVRWREIRFRLSRLRPGAPKPRQAATRCWVADCGTCGDELTDEDEGFIVHASSLTDLHRSLDAYGWRICPDEAYCPDDAPECSEAPPPSPAELEAAGQLRLPGVA